MLKYTFTAAIVGGILLAATSQPAHANDYRQYPGSMCVRWSGPSQGLEPLDYSSKYNPSSSAIMYVDCPIVKNALTNTVDMSLAYVVDQNPSKNVSCTLVASRRESAGFVANMAATKSSSGSSGGAQLLQTGALTGPGSGTSYINWYISCAVPPSSSIVNYYTSEVAPLL